MFQDYKTRHRQRGRNYIHFFRKPINRFASVSILREKLRLARRIIRYSYYDAFRVFHMFWHEPAPNGTLLNFHTAHIG